MTVAHISDFGENFEIIFKMTERYDLVDPFIKISKRLVFCIKRYEKTKFNDVRKNDVLKINILNYCK